MITAEKKRITTFCIKPETFQMLKEHKVKHGISGSWLVDSLLTNYLRSWGELEYEEKK